MKRLTSKTKETALNLIAKTSLQRAFVKEHPQKNPCYFCLKKILMAQT